MYFNKKHLDFSYLRKINSLIVLINLEFFAFGRFLSIIRLILPIIIFLNLNLWLDFIKTELFVIGLFLFLIINNLIGLSLTIEPISVWPIWTIFIRFLIWISSIIKVFKNRINIFLKHLVPRNLNLIISFGLFTIEFLRNYIRSITLGLRLLANIASGHLFCELILEQRSRVIFLRRFLCYEIFVAIIQALIFSLLTITYLEERENML